MVKITSISFKVIPTRQNKIDPAILFGIGFCLIAKAYPFLFLNKEIKINDALNIITKITLSYVIFSKQQNNNNQIYKIKNN